MRRAALAAVLLAAACGKGERSRIGRSDGGGPAVQVVDRGAAVASPRAPEREPNDDAATAIALGATGMRGALDGATDVDVYAITSDGARMLAARLTAMAGIDGKLELRDESFTVIATADRGGAGVAEAFPNVSLDRGRYFLVVSEIVHAPKKKPKVDAATAGRVGPGPAYELTAVQTTDPPPGGEREPDDDQGAANDVTLGAPVSGYVGWKGDVDVWKLAIDGLADGDGLDVALTAVEKVALTVEVTDAGGRRLVKQTGAVGAALTLRSLAPRVAPGEPTVQYLKISGAPAGPDQPYTLTVASRLLELDEEVEPNDAVDRANPLRFGTEDTGTMRGDLGPGDVDRFVLSPSPGAGTLDVILEPPPGVEVALVATGGAAATGARVSDRTQLSATVAVGQAVTLTLTGKASKGAVAGPYQLRWSLSAPSAPPAVPDDYDDDPMPPEEE